MLTDIEITGFQGHKDSTLSLGPGVNVIIGESDSGKSSVVRLLAWIFKNRPKGDGFRNTGLGKKDLVSGSVAFDDDSWIVRSKGGKTNQYEIESGVMKALRTDVPQEVSAISKIQDVNIQSQHPSEQYFMLTENPGQVAKQFNKVVGLTIMDDTLIKINGNVRNTKHKVDSVNESIDSHKKKIKDLVWTEDASVMLNQLVKDELAINAKIKKSDQLYNIVEEYKVMQQEYKKLKGLSHARKDLLVLSDSFGKITDKEKSLNVLVHSVKVLTQLESKLVSTTTLKKAVKLLPALFLQENAVELALDLKRDLQKIVNQIITCDKQAIPIEKERLRLAKRWESYSGKPCPICGGSL